MWYKSNNTCLILIAAVCGNALSGCNNNIGGVNRVNQAEVTNSVNFKPSANTATKERLSESSSATFLTVTEKRGVQTEDDLVLIVQSEQQILRIIYLNATTGVRRLNNPEGLTKQMANDPVLLKDFINRSLGQLTQLGVPADNAQAVYYDSDEQVLHWLAFSDDKTNWQEYALSVAAADAPLRVEQQHTLSAKMTPDCNLALKVCGLLRYQPTIVGQYLIDVTYQTDGIMNEDGEVQDGVLHERYLSGSQLFSSPEPMVNSVNRNLLTTPAASGGAIEVSGEVRSPYNWTGKITHAELNFIADFDKNAQLGTLVKLKDPIYWWVTAVVPPLVLALIGGGAGSMRYAKKRSNSSKEVEVNLFNGLEYRHFKDKNSTKKDTIIIKPGSNELGMPFNELEFWLEEKVSFSDGLFKIEGKQGGPASNSSLFTYLSAEDFKSARPAVRSEIQAELDRLGVLDKTSLGYTVKKAAATKLNSDMSDHDWKENADKVIKYLDDEAAKSEINIFDKKVREIFYNAPVRDQVRQLTNLNLSFVINMFEKKYGVSGLPGFPDWRSQDKQFDRAQFQSYVKSVDDAITSDRNFETKVFPKIGEKHDSNFLAINVNGVFIGDLLSDSNLSSGKKRFLENMEKAFDKKLDGINDLTGVRPKTYAEFKQAYRDWVVGELNTIGTAYDMKSAAKAKIVGTLIGGVAGVGVKFIFFSDCGGQGCSTLSLISGGDSGDIKAANYPLDNLLKVLEVRVPFTANNHQYNFGVAQSFTASCADVFKDSGLNPENGVAALRRDGQLLAISDINNQICSVGKIPQEMFIHRE